MNYKLRNMTLELTTQDIIKIEQAWPNQTEVKQARSNSQSVQYWGWRTYYSPQLCFWQLCYHHQISATSTSTCKHPQGTICMCKFARGIQCIFRRIAQEPSCTQITNGACSQKPNQIAPINQNKLYTKVIAILSNLL